MAIESAQNRPVISSSVYYVHWVTCFSAHHIPYFFSVLYFSRTAFAIFFRASLVFLRQFYGRRLFFELSFSRDLRSTVWNLLFLLYSKAFQITVYLWYMPFLVLCFNIGSGCFSYPWFWLIRHLFGHSLACVFCSSVFTNAPFP